MNSSERLSYLMNLLRDLSLDEDPVRSINRYAVGMRQLFGDQAMISVSLRGVAEGTYRVMRFLHQPGVELEGMYDVLFAGGDSPAVSGGILAEFIARGEPALLRDIHVSGDPVLKNQIAPYRVLLGFPVYTAGEALNWMFFLHTDPGAFSEQDVENRILQANLMGGFTNSKRVAMELRQAAAWIHREVDEIAELQKGLLPAALPQTEWFEMAASYATYDRAGGDYYHAFTLPREAKTDPPESAALCIFIADASGHGPSAAFVIGMVYTLLHSFPHALRGPGAMLDHINRCLSQTAINHSFVTGFFGILEYSPRPRLRYACAGHPMPLIRRGDRVIPLPAARNIPLGIDHNNDHHECEIEIEPGDWCLFYTDGITEARNAAGVLFGDERLRESLLADHSGTCEEVLEYIHARLRAHLAGVRPQDDQTLLLLRIR